MGVTTGEEAWPGGHGFFAPRLNTSGVTLAYLAAAPSSLARGLLICSLLVSAVVLYKKWTRLRFAVFTMATFFTVAAFLLAGPRIAYSQGTSSTLATSTQTSAASRPLFTVPASADVGQNVIPWIQDPKAVDPQAVCPGYTASNVQTTNSSFTANLNLAGPPCNLYGNDIENLTLTVELQDTDRLHVEIKPLFLGRQNETWFSLPEALVPKPASTAPSNNSLEYSWSNAPTFALTVKRKETGDVLFTTNGSKLVYEDQFIEFVSPLPENYNLYGLGEVIHGFRLGNNLTRELVPFSTEWFSSQAHHILF